jgi:hypothetical protein
MNLHIDFCSGWTNLIKMTIMGLECKMNIVGEFNRRGKGNKEGGGFEENQSM